MLKINFMKKINRIVLSLLAILFIVFPLLGFSDIVQARLGMPTPAPGDGCLPDTGDPDCANMGVEGSCPDIEGSAGLIPCGRDYNDPDTVWDECKACNLCSLILMGQLMIEFMLKISAIAAILAIAMGGFLYMFAAGNQGTLETAKSIIKNVLIGFVIVFIAWVLVDTILSTFGYIDPIDGVGADKWHAVSC